MLHLACRQSSVNLAHAEAFSLMLKENIARHSQYCFFREFWGVLGDRDNREQGGESILSGVGDKGIRANFVDGQPISIALQADEFSRAHRRS